MQEIEERTLETRDEATIESIFDALRSTSGEHVSGAEVASWLEGGFYYIRVAYEDESINQRGNAMDFPEQLEDGHFFHFYVLENDKLVFPDGELDAEGEQGMVAVPFDFQWFEVLLTKFTDERLLTEKDILKPLKTETFPLKK